MASVDSHPLQRPKARRLRSMKSKTFVTVKPLTPTLGDMKDLPSIYTSSVTSPSITILPVTPPSSGSSTSSINSVCETQDVPPENVEQEKDLWSNYLHESASPSPIFRPVGTRPVQLRRELPSIVVGGSFSVPYLDSAISQAVDVVCGAWAIVLSRHSDDHDSIFGLQQAQNRVPLPLRVRINRQQPVSQLLSQVREWTKRIKLSKLKLDDIRLLNDGADSACQFQTVVEVSEVLSDLQYTTNRECFGMNGPPIALRVMCSFYQGELSFQARTDETILSVRTVRLLLDELEHTVWQIFQTYNSNETLIHELESLGPYGRREMLKYNRPLPTRINGFIHEIIGNRANEQPQAPAVDSWDARLSYSELWSKSTALAKRLRSLGCGPGMFIPIIQEKSSFSVIALLAVFQVGAAAVALDPNLPVERQHMIISDVQAHMVIISQKHQYKAPVGTRVLVLDDASFLANGADDPLKPTHTPDDPAYVMFTSGSTGKPKGVVVSHSAFLSSSEGYTKAVHLTNPSSRVLQYSSFTFDVSMMETLSTLTIGGCVCVPSEEDRLNDVGKCINSLGVNWAILTPSVASLLDPEDVPGLEVLCFAGEALSPELADRWADHVKTINAYGPAEASVLTIVSEPRISGSGPVYLGRPPNGSVWIVDQDNFNQVVPFNSVGEIILEGPALATGYLNDPEKTSSAFVLDPDFLRPVTGPTGRGSVSRVYRTGDLGRMNECGVIEYLGRKDDQVKINGQRVELGEIEHHIKRLLSASFEVVVEVLKPPSNILVLVCFISKKFALSSANSGHYLLDESQDNIAFVHDIKALAEGVRQQLTDVLPNYMIPQLFLPCQGIPRTPSGKTDRKRLKALGNDMSLITRLAQSHSSSAVSDHFSVVLSQTMLKLRGIWSRILGVPENSISPGDDLFKLGANSMAVIKVVAACRSLGLQLNFTDVFQTSKISDMAALCDSRSKSIPSLITQPSIKQAVQPVQIQPFSLLDSADVANLLEEAALQCGVVKEDIEDLFPCTKMQEGLMAVNMTRPGSYTAQFVHELPHGIDVPRLRKVWDEVYETFPILRSRFVMTMSGSLQAVMRSQIKWHEAHDLETYLANDTTPMLPGTNLSRFAVIVTKNGVATHLVWTLHHMLYDGWNIALMLRRANELYCGVPVTIVDDFRRFIAYTNTLDTASLDRWWKRELQDVSPSTFPVALQKGYLPVARTVLHDHLDFTRGRNVSGMTLPTLVRAAWAIMISDFSRTNDVLFGAIVSGRSTPLSGIETIPGPVLAIVPIRLRVESNQSVLDFLQGVQNHSVTLMPYEQAGLQRIMSINDDTRRGCEFQNLLIVQFPWEHDEGPFGQPMYREEVTTYPVTCEARLLENGSGIDFATHVDEDIADRVVVARAISSVKSILNQLMNLTPASKLTVGELDLDAEIENEEDQKGDPHMKEGGPVHMLQDQLKPVTVRACIHDIISEMANSQPDAEALYTSRQSVSYRTLDQLSTKLAAHLIHIGVETGSVVPICFEKSYEAIISMLAVLKAGGAFVGLDPSQPLARLKNIVQDTESSFLLSSSFHARATSLPMAKTIVVTRTWLDRLPTPEDRENIFRNRVSPENLAYLIYTSGSTGTPKGVIISHMSFSSGAMQHGPRQGLRPKKSRVLQFASYSFDASLVEILTSLMHGATICIPTDKERMEGLEVFLQSAQVTYGILTPSVARILRLSNIPLLETLVLVGESADETLTSRLLDAQVEVFIGYGPSECSVVLTAQRLSPGMNPRNIGPPVACRLWIINPDDVNELVPKGEVGELLVEGPTVGQGYLNNEEATARSFINYPIWAETNEKGVQDDYPRRMYRTGDLVRLVEDGSFYYIGRKDLQVKVNGQRIELGEIEAHLSQCRQVKHGLVVFPSEGYYAGQLTAVIQLEDTATSTSREFDQEAATIRTTLSAHVTSSMVPLNWLNINDFSDKGIPLLPSGKVDRKTVLSWLATYKSTTNSLIGGKSSQELTIQDEDDEKNKSVESDINAIFAGEEPAWALASKISSMLRKDRAPAVQDKEWFLDVILPLSGLDSLHMMELIYHISGKYRVKVSMQFLMDQDTTIRKVAQHIVDSQSATAAEKLVTVKSIDIMAEINKYDAKITAVQSCASEHSVTNCRNKRSDILEDNSRCKQSGPNPRPQNQGRIVLLTGATGFLGTQILRQLLENPYVVLVIALVRDSATQSAQVRTVEAAQKALWWTELHAEKLDVWRSNLAESHLGLDTELWNKLKSGAINAFIHAGAAVHWTRSYADLEDINVRSTTELLRLAVSSRRPRLVYVSGGRQWQSEEECEEDVAGQLAGDIGYSQTKFVAEAVIHRAALRYTPGEMNNLAIIKPGLIIGTPHEGVPNIDDYLWRLTAANISIGAFNASQAHQWLYLSHATTLANMAVDAALSPGQSLKPIHYANDGLTWSALWSIVCDMGYELKSKSGPQWLAAVQSDLKDRRERHPLWPLSHILEEEQAADDTENTEPHCSVAKVPLHLRLAVIKNMQYLAKIGFIPTPRSKVTFINQNGAQMAAFSRSSL